MTLIWYRAPMLGTFQVQRHKARNGIVGRQVNRIKKKKKPSQRNKNRTIYPCSVKYESSSPPITHNYPREVLPSPPERGECNIEHSVRRRLLTYCGGAAVPPSLQPSGLRFAIGVLTPLRHRIKGNGTVEPIRGTLLLLSRTMPLLLKLPPSFHPFSERPGPTS